MEIHWHYAGKLGEREREIEITFLYAIIAKDMYESFSRTHHININNKQLFYSQKTNSSDAMNVAITKKKK